MCGRINQKTEGHEIAKMMRVVQSRIDLALIRPRYNIAPSQQVPLVTLEPDTSGTPVRTLREMRWGFVPIWADSATKGTRPINATAEKVATSGMFRNSFKKWRCLVPATGFYEWHVNEDGSKTPFHITLEHGGVLAFAGITSLWKPKQSQEAGNAKVGVENEANESELVHTFAIITTTPTPLVALVHDRMPVIVPQDHWDTWLDPSTPVDRLQSLLVPFSAEPLTAYPVSTRVNSPRFDDPSLIEPVAGGGTVPQGSLLF